MGLIVDQMTKRAGVLDMIDVIQDTTPEVSLFCDTEVAATYASDAERFRAAVETCLQAYARVRGKKQAAAAESDFFSTLFGRHFPEFADQVGEQDGEDESDDDEEYEDDDDSDDGRKKWGKKRGRPSGPKGGGGWGSATGPSNKRQASTSRPPGVSGGLSATQLVRSNASRMRRSCVHT